VFQGYSSNNQISVWLFQTCLKLIPLLQKLHGTCAEAERGLQGLCRAGPLYPVHTTLCSCLQFLLLLQQGQRSRTADHIVCSIKEHLSFAESDFQVPASLPEQGGLTPEQPPEGSLAGHALLQQGCSPISLQTSSKKASSFKPQGLKKAGCFYSGWLLIFHMKSAMRQVSQLQSRQKAALSCKTAD